MIKTLIDGPKGTFRLECIGDYPQLMVETGMLLSKILVLIEKEAGIPVNVSAEAIGSQIAKHVEMDRKKEGEET